MKILDKQGEFKDQIQIELNIDLSPDINYTDANANIQLDSKRSRKEKVSS